MRTFYAWLIANVESVTTFLVVAAFEWFLFTDPSVTMDTGERVGLALLGALVVSLGKSLLGGIPSRDVLTDVVNLLIIVGAYAVLFVFGIAGMGHQEPFFTSVFWATLPICIVSLLVAVVAALFTYRNMGEVVSRRMIYHNSRVSLFEITWMYTFNRFVAVLSGLSSLGLFVFVGQLLVDKVMEQGL